jgi:hypothetical protein
MINATPWAGRRRNGCPTVPLEVSAEDRARLEVMLRGHHTKAIHWLGEIVRREPRLFEHW